jgi:fatty acid desaturase
VLVPYLTAQRSGLAEGRCGWLMHEGGHYSLTGNITLDRHIQMLCYGFGCGMSGAWWRNQHNKHHATPQKEGYDVDLKTMPLVCFHKLCAWSKKTNKLLSNKYWIRYQAVLFAPVTCLLVALGWQLYLHPRHCLRRKLYLEMSYMAARYALVVGLAQYMGVSFSTGLCAYLFYNWAGASYIFCNFAVSHTHLPVVPEDEHVDWVVYAAKHTMNCENSAWCNWWMSYLNFQIEHHLFPSMPQFRHPIVSPRVKALFEKHGLKYDQRPYFTAMSDTFKNLHNVGYDVFFG